MTTLINTMKENTAEIQLYSFYQHLGKILNFSENCQISAP